MRASSDIKQSKRLTYEQIVFITDQVTEATGKKIITLPGSADFRALLPKLELYKNGDEAFIFIKTYIHAMAVYFCVQDDRLKCFIGDSQGWHWKYYPTRNLITDITKTLGNQVEIILPNTQLQAQDNQSGCIVFTTLCLNYCAHHGKEFIKELENIEVETDRDKLDKGLRSYGITETKNIRLLKENLLPDHFLEDLKMHLEMEGSNEIFWQDSIKKIVNPHLVESKYSEYRTATQTINHPTPETFASLRESANLSSEFFSPDVEDSTIYNLNIIQMDKKYILEISFEQGPQGEAHLMYDNCIAYTHEIFPSNVTTTELQVRNIFSGFDGQVRIDIKNGKFIFETDSKEKLEAVSKQLGTMNYAYQLYIKGMHQQLGLAHFAFELKEALKIFIKQDEITGGLYLGEVNAALNYFIKSAELESVGVLQEEVGVNNPDLMTKIDQLIGSGYKKIVFAINTNTGKHQIAVVIDTKNETITLIDSEKKSKQERAEENKQLIDLLKQSALKNFQIVYENPVAYQPNEWSCGVDVCLNVLHKVAPDFLNVEDRINANLNTWLRRIMRAAEKEQHEYQRRINNIINVVSLVNKVYVNVNNKEELNISNLMNFLTDFVKFPTLTINELKTHPAYKNQYTVFNTEEQLWLTAIYALSELSMDTNQIKNILPHMFKLLKSSIINLVVEKQKKGKLVNNQSLIEDIRYAFEKEIRMALATQSNLSDKIDYLSAMYLATNSKGDWNIPIQVMDTDEVANYVNWVKAESGQNDNIEFWLNYLFFTQLNNITKDLINAEKSHHREISSKDKARQLVGMQLKAYIKEITELLPQTEKVNLDYLGNLGKKLYLLSPKQWVEILALVKFDDVIVHTLNKLRDSQLTFFHGSLIKILNQLNREAEIFNLLKNARIQESLSNADGFNVLELACLLPPQQSKLLISVSMIAINDFLATKQISAVNPTLTKNDLITHIEKSMPADLEECLQLLKELPLILTLELIDRMSHSIINNTDDLIALLKILPKDERTKYAVTFQNYIKNSKELYLVSKSLSPDKRFEFIMDNESCITSSKFNKLLELIPEDKVLTLIYRNIKKITHGATFGSILNYIPEKDRYTVLRQHADNLENGLLDVINDVPKVEQRDFIMKYQKLIGGDSGSPAADLIFLMQYIPEVKDQLTVILNQANKMDARDMITVLKVTSIDLREELMKFTFNFSFPDFLTAAELIKLCPPSLQLDFLIAHQDKIDYLIRHSQSLNFVLNMLDREEDEVKYFIHFIQTKKFDELLNANLLNEKHFTLNEEPQKIIRLLISTIKTVPIENLQTVKNIIARENDPHKVLNSISQFIKPSYQATQSQTLFGSKPKTSPEQSLDPKNKKGPGV